MAILKAPLLSLGASGQIGKALVASTWKGVKYMRQHVTPANPNTADQQTQRGYVTALVTFWRTYLTNALARTAWNVYAGLLSMPMSGFNAFSQAALKLSLTNPAASFATQAAAGAAYVVVFTTKNLDDGATGDEAGNFEVWKGTTKNDLSKLETKAIAAGTITTSALGAAPADVYVQIRKDGYARSGAHKITIAA